MQSETMLYAYRDFRRQFGESRKCGGALAWQLNDCWPCASWGIVDYFHRKKPAYYAIKRLLKPLAIAVRREHKDWSISHARPSPALGFEVWIMSSHDQEASGEVRLQFISVRTGKEARSPVIANDVSIDSNGTTHVFKDVVVSTVQEPVMLVTTLRIDGKIVSRDMDWPQPYKYLPLTGSKPHVKVRGETLTVSANRPIKGLVFEEPDGVWFGDNCIDVIPGDEQVIEIKGYKGTAEQLKYKWLS